MPTETDQAESKPLSVEEAVALLDEQPSPAGESKAEPEASGAMPEADAESSPDTTDAAETAAASEASALEAPASWDETARARFAQLPADVQAVIASREAEHQKALTTAREEATEAKRDVDKRVSAEIGTLKTLLDKLVPEAAKTFKSRWADIDWTTLPEKVGTDEAFKLKAQFEKERDQLQQLDSAQKLADDRAYADFVKTESAKLKQVAPDLVDSDKGQGRREALGKFLTSQGYTPEQIRFMSAHDASIAYDAMRWRDAEAKTRALARAKPAARPSPAPKPSALAATRTLPAKKTDEAFRRLTKTGRVDDAVAYLNARSK